MRLSTRLTDQWRGEGGGSLHDASGPSRKGSLPTRLCQQDQLTGNWERTEQQPALTDRLAHCLAVLVCETEGKEAQNEDGTSAHEGRIQVCLCQEMRQK